MPRCVLCCRATTPPRRCGTALPTTGRQGPSYLPDVHVEGPMAGGRPLRVGSALGTPAGDGRPFGYSRVFFPRVWHSRTRPRGGAQHRPADPPPPPPPAAPHTRARGPNPIFSGPRPRPSSGTRAMVPCVGGHCRGLGGYSGTAGHRGCLRRGCGTATPSLSGGWRWAGQTWRLGALSVSCHAPGATAPSQGTAGGGGGGLTDWSKFSAGPSVNQNISLAFSTPFWTKNSPAVWLLLWAPTSSPDLPHIPSASAARQAIAE